MPTRLCSHSRCPEPAYYRGRCTAHARTHNRDTHHNKHVYNTKRWRILRRAVLVDHPICSICDDAISTDADHIIPIQAGGAPYDPLNVQALCSPCHSRKTKMEQATR